MKLDILIDNTLALVKNHGYRESTWKFGFLNGRCNSIRQFFLEHSKEDFCIELANEYVDAVQNRYEQGEISYSRCTHLKKIAVWLTEVYITGELHWQIQSPRKTFLCEYFKNALIEYIKSMQDILSLKNIQGQKSTILSFLEFLQKEKNYCDFTMLSLADIQDYVRFMRQRRKGRIDFVIHATKRFISYLYVYAIIKKDLTPALYQQSQKVTKILKGFSHDEVDRILAQPNRNTEIGKRDYAMILLGRNTGLRIGDIINLKSTDINWQNNELKLTQRKTKKCLILPLEPETQNAIADYVENGRPKSDLPYIFLKHFAPYNLISQQQVTTFFSEYRTRAGIATTPNDGRGFHGLRRSLASWMLESDIPLTTISQVLGHNNLDSAAPYLSFDEKRLQLCGLSFDGIEVTKEGLK